MSVFSQSYNALPSLKAAWDTFKDQRAQVEVEGQIRSLFIDFGVYQQYGLALLHKHFTIEDDERLVEYGPSASSWKVGLEDPINASKYEGHIVPRSYRFMKGATVPYEFAFAAEPRENEDLAFFQSLSNMLYRLGLQELFGVRVLDNRDPQLSLEVTEGKTNIMMPRGSVPDSAVIEALWVFGKDEDDRCHCREVCFATSTGHSGDHSCG